MFLPRPIRNGLERALADISAQIDMLRGDCCCNHAWLLKNSFPWNLRKTRLRQDDLQVTFSMR
jgi:hypothetical protein